MTSLNLLFAIFFLFQFLACGLLALEDYSEDLNWQEDIPDFLSEDKDKRHLAAMAKNGRLPISHFNGKRISDTNNMAEIMSTEEKYNSNNKQNDTKFIQLNPEQKRHIGAFLRMHGHPISAFRGYDDENPDKRNIAALARMGRLQAKSWPYMRPIIRGSSEDEDSECLEEQTNRIREKRYIAALARNGRLPPLRGYRPQWWSDKRTKNQEVYDWSPYKSQKSLTDKRIQKDLGKTRCKKTSVLPISVEEDNELGPDLSNFQKRNVALLARKGLLSSGPFVPGK